MQILPVEQTDAKEIQLLFAEDAVSKTIWPTGVGQNWYWYWREKSTKEEWVKVMDGSHTVIIASAHWSVRKDGTRNLKDIVVQSSVRGQGIGRILIERIGRPIICKTDHDSAANHFYQRLGFVKGETLPSKSGKKLLTAYTLLK